jgi:sugar phosphate isomerase/epimerase
MVINLSITTDLYDDGGPIFPKLKIFAECGFTHIHWCEHWSRDVLYENFYIEGLRKILKQLNIKLLDTHNAETSEISLSSVEEEKRKQAVRLLTNRILFTAELGGDCVVIHPPSYIRDRTLYKKKWKSLERSLVEEESLCKKTKIKLAIENSSKPTEEFYTILKKFSPSFIGFCFDSGHANIGKNLELIELLNNRVIALHLHDNYGIKDEHSLPGRGTVNWQMIIDALKKIGYSKPLNFELRFPNDNISVSSFVKKAYKIGKDFTQRLKS